MLLAHSRQLANLSFARQFLDAIHITDFVRAPDQRDGLRSESLYLQQLQHRRMILCKQFRLDRKLPVLKEFLQVPQHTLADAGNFKHLLGISDQVLYLLRVVLDRLCGIAVGADAKRILPIDFEQVGGFVKNVGDGLVVHRLKINKIGGQS